MFYGTQIFIAVFTTTRHWSLSWASLIQSTPQQFDTDCQPQRLCTEINSLKTFINELISEHFVEQSVLTSSRRKYLLITAVVQSSVRTVLLRGETHHLTPPCHANYNPVNTRQTSFIRRQQPQLPRHPPTFELGMVTSFSRDKWICSCRMRYCSEPESQVAKIHNYCYLMYDFL